jgi:hypothetical protein
MANANNKFFAAIRDTYTQLNESFDAMYAKCATQEEREKLRALLSSARDAFFQAAADALADDNIIVEDIHADLQKVNSQLKQQLQSLKDITATLNIATEAVRLSGSLTALASSSPKH